MSIGARLVTLYAIELDTSDNSLHYSDECPHDMRSCIWSFALRETYPLSSAVRVRASMVDEALSCR